MRYFIKPNAAEESLLDTMLAEDSTPRILPVFPQDEMLGLVVLHLISGRVLGEVLPCPAAVITACGPGLPLGRLYFQVPRTRLFDLCPELKPEVFGACR
jgi:hypothetical protein